MSKKAIPKIEGVTESIIARANLLNEERLVARYFYDLPSAGRKTELWIKEHLDDARYRFLVRCANVKIRALLKKDK